MTAKKKTLDQQQEQTAERAPFVELYPSNREARHAERDARLAEQADADEQARQAERTERTARRTKPEGEHDDESEGEQAE